VLSKDFHHAVRSLRKRPGFTVIVVITLALGIGTSVAIFGVTNAVLLRPLPYKDPARLAIACYDMRKRNVSDFPFSNANFLDLRMGASAALEDIAAVRTGRVVVPALDGTPEQVRVGIVSTNLFPYGQETRKRVKPLSCCFVMQDNKWVRLLGLRYWPGEPAFAFTVRVSARGESDSALPTSRAAPAFECATVNVGRDWQTARS
jgi:hypothetical protein